MIAFMQYMFRHYMRSYRYVAPLLFFVAAISMVYSESSKFILSTYSFGGMWVFVISTWLAYGYIEVEHVTQQQITILHIGGLKKYLRARLYFISLVTFLVACYAFMYPLILHRFSAPVTTMDLFVSIVENVSLALLGIGVGIFFNERFFSKKSSAILGLVFVTILSLVGEQISAQLPPFLRFVAWVLPPVSHTVSVVAQWASFSGFDRYVSLIWPFVYSLILMTLYVKLSQKKLFE